MSGLFYRAPSVVQKLTAAEESFTALLRDAAADDGGLGAGRCRLKTSNLTSWLGHWQKLRYARARADPCLLHARIGTRFISEKAAKL